MGKRKITLEELSELCDAKEKICTYCGKTECTSCMVNKLINKGFNEAKGLN